ncbi:phage/plasmid primase, P4 family [Candidatus Binatus sp.]|uniref:phage/plasmid primase, P4 family n=1 Tax=Candidatus Binatus sp. TaxID=2811406 RepID=UPI003C65993D
MLQDQSSSEDGLRTPRPEDFISKRCAVDSAPPGTPAPEWQRFLETTFPLRDHSGPDFELIAFLQRWCGYLCTGLTTEQKFLFLHSTGRSGKNLFADQPFGILRDYAVRLPSEVLMQRPVEPHRAELMPLRGARLIVANEIRKGACWNQSRLMEIVGGDMLTANPMRGNPVTFPVVGKLMVLGNHRPTFESHNAAAIQRLLLVEFRMQFIDPDGAPASPDLPPERIARRDNGLAAKLRAEWPAIFRWMIDGCREWQRIGLKPPPQVIADSSESISNDDIFAQWRAECCEDVDPHGAKGRDLISLLIKSFNEWCGTRRERPASYNAFSTMLGDHDVGKFKTNAGMVPIGFQLTGAERARLTRSEELL